MRVSVRATVLALVALFCGAVAGPAAAASGSSPTVTGAPLVGEPLTATPNLAALGDSITWGSCNAHAIGDVLPAPTISTTYTLAPSDVGTQVCAFELAGPAADGTYAVDGISDPVGPVGPGPVLSAAGAPVTEGQTLSVTQGAWGSGMTPSDVWEDCDASGANCTPIVSDGSAVTGTTYTVSRTDVGATIAVQETATSSSFPTVPLTTAPTGVVSATPPVATSPAQVSGTAQVGDTLTATTGSWTNDPTSYTYQWERCSDGSCTLIQGATKPTYVPVDADVGDTLEVLVTAAVDGVAGSAYPSYPTSPVVGISTSSSGPNPSPAPAPVVPVTKPRKTKAIGRLTATMRWTFRYAPRFTQIVALAVEGPALGSRIATRCVGRGCPFPVHRVRVRGLARCRAAPSGHCRAPRQVNLEWEFRHRRLRVGARVTITITRAHDIGKYYRFVVRRRRAPSVRIRCLAPGSMRPGKGCSGP